MGFRELLLLPGGLLFPVWPEKASPCTGCAPPDGAKQPGAAGEFRVPLWPEGRGAVFVLLFHVFQLFDFV